MCSRSASSHLSRLYFISLLAVHFIAVVELLLQQSGVRLSHANYVWQPCLLLPIKLDFAGLTAHYRFSMWGVAVFTAFSLFPIVEFSVFFSWVFPSWLDSAVLVHYVGCCCMFSFCIFPLWNFPHGWIWLCWSNM